MDIRQLRYFLTVAQEGQFTRAAERLNMAQPPLSQQIQSLEEELDVKLFKRGRHLELTQAGQALLIRSEEILELVGATKKELDDLSKGKQGTVSIGTVSSCGAFLLPKCMFDFHEKYPEVRFQIWESETYRIMEFVEKGIVDIGIVRTPFNLETYDYIYEHADSASDPMAAVFSRKWIAGLPDGPIKLETIKGLPFMIHRRYEKMIVDACEDQGFEPNILCKGDDMRSIISWAELGLGVAVVPKPPLNILKNEDLQYHEIDNVSLKTKTAVIWLKNSYLPTVVRNFIKTINESSNKI